MDEFSIFLLVWLAITAPPVILSWWGLFRKAGLPGWAAFVPGYNIYVLVVGVAKLSLLWFILMLVPPIQIIAAILVNIEIARRYGRSEAYGFGLTFLGFIFYPILAFGKAKYYE